ncbi:MAG: hypothetical protein N0C90_26270, partial [Candidatus Thiodiazotropha endolucinida]|nr:hypothetical protein [Candidatus Thiodiazotropha taylori]MCW4264855.1 hypothetical protein [Candidatus Thiodiazotropha endolucinida]
MDLSGIPAPVMNWEASNLPEAWKKFHQHVELIFQGPLAAKTEAEKVSYLLLWVGDKGRDVYNTWTGITDEEAVLLETYYTKFKNYCQPKLNPIFARYKFNNEVQGSSSIDQFVTRLKLLSIDCNFKAEKDEMIRDRIVFGTSSAKVRSKLIDEGEKLTLEKAVQIGQSYEYAQAQLKSMGNAISNQQEVHAVQSAAAKQSQKQGGNVPQRRRHKQQRRTATSTKKNCTRCGYESHPDGKTCPAMGKTCSKCSKKNHFAQCCKSSKASVNEISHTHGETISSDDSDFFVETIDTDLETNQAFVSVLLGPGKLPTQFKLDTGSQVNVLPESIFGRLKYKAPLQKPERQLSAYTGDKLDVRGRCTLKVRYKEQDFDIEFYIVSTKSSPILGMKSCLELELIKLVYSVDHLDPPDTPCIPKLDKQVILTEY